MTTSTTSARRKQTLLGIAPTMTGASPAPLPSDATPPEAEPAPFTPAPEPPPPPPAAPLVVPAANSSLRKQTLLGIAPSTPAADAVADASGAPAEASGAPAVTEDAAAPAVAEAVAAASVAPVAAEVPTAPAEAAPVAVEAQPYARLTSRAASKTDAPTTSDIAESPPESASDGGRPHPRSSADTSVGDDLPDLRRRRPRWLAPVAIAAVLGVGVVGLRSLDRPPPLPPVGAERPPATPGNPALGSAPIQKASDDGEGDEPQARGEGQASSPAAAAQAAEAAAAPSAAAPSAEPSAAPSTASAPATPTAASGDKVRVSVDSNPPGARLFWKGKEVGTTPFVLELDPGERHAYEMGLPGHVTRKVVIDGSQTAVRIGLRPESTPASGTAPRK